MKTLIPEIPRIETGRLVLKLLEDRHAEALRELTEDRRVYRYLPTFLFEKRYADPHEAVARLYTECLEDSLILGIFEGDSFCGLAELYGYQAEIHKISIGCRLCRRCWGRGIATQVIAALVRWLYETAGIEIITASSMVENHGSANALRKNGFSLVSSGALEDWGYPGPTVADKWIR